MHNAERRHAVAWRILSRFGPQFFKIFRGRKILRPKSREIVPKSMPSGGARPRHEPQRSPCTMQSVGMLWQVRLHAIGARSRTEIFKIFRGRKNFRPKSREIVPKSMPIAGARPRHEPQRS